MILFKACPRCDGDVDATYSDDVHCVQCSHRPEVVYPGPRIIRKAENGPAAPGMAFLGYSSNASQPMAPEDIAKCRRCGTVEVVRLEKLRPEDNACYRCRRCGHVFSPAIQRSTGS